MATKLDDDDDDSAGKKLLILGAVVFAREAKGNAGCQSLIELSLSFSGLDVQSLKEASFVVRKRLLCGVCGFSVLMISDSFCFCEHHHRKTRTLCGKGF
jgi:hypothetical protein